MDSGFYSAFTGFAARMDALDLVANNLANVSTPGYKSQLAFYKALPAWLTESLSTPLNQAVNRFGVLGGSRLDLSASNLMRTENPTDVAIETSGFFTVQLRKPPSNADASPASAQQGQTNAASGATQPASASGPASPAPAPVIRYTRDGSFQLNTQRQLVTAQGDLVLGEQGPIVVPSGQLTISEDGTLSVDGAVFAKLRITDFASSTDLRPEGSTYFAAQPNSGKASTTARLQQGSLESSNSDPVKATVSLIELQRTAQMMEKALSIFHNEFNKTAAQDLPRV